MQLTYDINPEVLALGQLAYVGMPYEILSCNNLANEVVFGRLASKVSGSDLTVKRFNSPTETQYGVIMSDDRVAIDEDTTLTDAYPANSTVGVITNGYVAVLVDQAVTSDDPVYARHSTTLNVQTITFDVDFVNLNSIAMTINGDVQTATVFATDHATTIAALAAKIEAHEDVLTAVAAGRVITVTSVNSEAITFVITVTLGAAQAVDTIVTTVTGAAGNQSQGVFRKDSDSNKASLVSNAKFVTSADADGLAILKVSF